MPIQLTDEGMKAIFPRAPQAVREAFVAKQHLLDEAGITTTRTRLAYFFANIEHECNGFTIPNLTENINYTHKRMAEVFPARAGRTEADVIARFGDEPGWQRDAFDVLYGDRMGNGPPSSHDGSTFIGRGGPQWTGRDGYAEVGRRARIPALTNPGLVSSFSLQPEVCVAFWDWKKLNALADVGDFNGVVRRWNGGTNGMADRLAKLEGNDPFIKRLSIKDQQAMPAAKSLPGAPPTPAPPPEVVAEATKKERTARAGGAASTASGAGAEGYKTGTAQPDKPAVLSPLVTWTLIGAGIAVIVVAGLLIARKKGLLKEHWF